MSFWNSPLIKNIEQGELPEIDTNVTIDNDSLVRIGVVLVISAVVIIAVNKIVNSL